MTALSALTALSDRRIRIAVDASACDLDDLAPCGGIDVTVGGDIDWDEFVQRATTSSWPGVERLGGAAGTVAEAVRTNSEADGRRWPTWSPRWGRGTELTRGRGPSPSPSASSGTSTSRFQERLPDGQYRYDVVDVSFLFEQGDKTTPIRDPQLAAALGIEPGTRLPLGEYAERRARS